MGEMKNINQTFYTDIREIIINARENAIRGVEYMRLMMYWRLGERIFIEEQRGQDRIPTKPAEIIKDPMFLEFLGLKREAHYYEQDLESALITHLQEFLLELGNGFSFVARQRRILLEDDEFFADLVLYNRLLRCFAVIEIKTHKLTHEDLGQLQMYVNYYDRYEKLPDETPTIGILLCTAKNDLLAKITLPEDNTNILTSKYQLYLPSEEEFIEEIKEVIDLTEEHEENE